MEDRKFLSIEEMQEKIQNYGMKRIWNLIESINNPLERIANRQLFFIAGGHLDK